MARIITADEALMPAVEALSAGRLVAVPTETVYGLAGDAANGAAVARIYEAKGRPRFNPLIAHVADVDMAMAFADFDPLSRRLAEQFWPGPLTLVLPLRPGAAIHPLALAGLDTVAVRAPRGFAETLLATLGRPIVAPSANSSGKVSTTTAQAVAADLGERVDLIVDGGPTPVGVESTIVKVESGRLRLLRPGGITAEEIEVVSGQTMERNAHARVEAPGQLESHYAPHACVRVNATTIQPGEALLGFGPVRAANAALAADFANLSHDGDLREAAANLFGMLVALDKPDIVGIAVEPVPESGLGEAINDRLRRAAAPRSGDG